MALLYQPPRNPYSGTELGASGNVYCQNITLIDGGQGFNIGPGTATDYQYTPTGNWNVGTTYTSLAIAPTTTTLSAGSNGSGLTATFAVTGSGAANDNPANITVLISNPGVGYQPGDVLVWSNADVEAAILAAIALAGGTSVTAGTVGGAAAPLGLTYTITAMSDSGSDQGFQSVSRSTGLGWQFVLPNTAETEQYVELLIPDDNDDDNNLAANEKCVMVNITGHDPVENAQQTAGLAVATIFNVAGGELDGADIIRIRRTGAGISLDTCYMTVRVVDRQLQIPL